MALTNFLCVVTILSALLSLDKCPSNSKLTYGSATDPFALLSPCMSTRHQEMVYKLKKLYRLPSPNKRSKGTSLLYISVLLVTLSNDVQIQPGPRMPTYPCGSCGKAVPNNQNSIQCDGCMTWHHINCQGMNVQTHKIHVEHDSYSWYCLKCGLPNFSTTYFETSDSSFETSNSFAVLNTSQTPLTSTPAKKISRLFAKKQSPSKFKVLNINFKSVVNKVQEFHCLLDTENPDIVIGTESWLLPDIASSEVFPEGYQSFRADRKSKASRGGGVFILVRNNFLPVSDKM